MSDNDRLMAAIAPIVGLRAAAPRLTDGRASLILDVTGLGEKSRAKMEEEVRAALLALPEVNEVRIGMTSEKRGRKLIAVGSGKGGVGKSTVAANLAIALKRSGLSVGIVDADIYGPSIPRLMHAEGSRPMAEEQKLIPVDTDFGVPILSMGQLVKPGQAIAWRGPMAASALGQLVDARWDDVDLLIVDLPPGTGDVQMSMIQKWKPAGAVIVSTPQDLALIDAARAVDLFKQSTVPLVGLVENMAGYQCPHCGEVSDPFGIGGAQAAASAMGMDFLGRVPLDIAIRTASDEGTPPAASDDAAGAPFHAIAAKVAAWLERSGSASVTG